jgi:hypothetical protein
MHSVLRNRSALGQKCNVQFKHKFEYTTDITLGRIVRLKLSSAFSLKPPWGQKNNDAHY